MSKLDNSQPQRAILLNIIRVDTRMVFENLTVPWEELANKTIQGNSVLVVVQSSSSCALDGIDVLNAINKKSGMNLNTSKPFHKVIITPFKLGLNGDELSMAAELRSEIQTLAKHLTT